MKTTQAVLLTAGAVIAYSLLRKAGATGNLVFFPDKIHSLDWDGLTPVLKAGVRVQNTSNQSLTLNSFAGNVFAESTLVGNVGSFIPQTILPNSQRVLMIDIRLMPLGIVNDIIKIFQYQNFSMQIEVDATANIDNLQVPVNLNYKIGL